MIRLVDTSAWIEWLIGSPTGAEVGNELPERAGWIVPTIVQFELSKWLTREMGEDRSDQVIAFTETCLVVDLDTSIALAAADISSRHKLAMADAVVYATARAYDADILTCDRHFQGLSGTLYLAKTRHG